jgi:phosphoenolpyruvate synthase/pyruvate phosphate dikinase
MELAVGLGEVLASGALRGLPYRMTYNTRTHELKILTFASFSEALCPGEAGLERKTVDYSEVWLTRDEEARERLASRLAAIARFIEGSLGFPQDIEGAVKGDDIFIVQTRSQQGLKKG